MGLRGLVGLDMWAGKVFPGVTNLEHVRWGLVSLDVRGCRVGHSISRRANQRTWSASRFLKVLMSSKYEVGVT